MDPEQWVAAHADALFHYAVGRLPDRADAEDAVQETFLAALRSQHSFRGDSAERTWLTAILKHKVVDTLRRSARRGPSTPVDDSDAEAEMFRSNGRWRCPPANFAVDEQDLLDRSEFWQHFESCVGLLPAKQARALMLHYVDGNDPSATCRQLGVTQNNLWVLLHRARLHLRANLEANWFCAGGR